MRGLNGNGKNTIEINPFAFSTLPFLINSKNESVFRRQMLVTSKRKST